MTHLKAANSLYKCLKRPIRPKERELRLSATQRRELMKRPDKRLKELPIRYMKIRSRIVKMSAPLASSAIPKDLSGSW